MERAKAAEADASLPARVAAHAQAHGTDVALLDAGGAMTYAELALRAEGVARWAVARGFGAGDVVGVLMPNCAEYVAIWLGLTRAALRRRPPRYQRSDRRGDPPTRCA